MKFIKKVNLIVAMVVIGQIDLFAMMAQAQLNNRNTSASSAINQRLVQDLVAATESWYNKNYPTVRTEQTDEKTKKLWDSLFLVFKLYKETNANNFSKYIQALYNHYESQGNNLKIFIIHNSLDEISSNFMQYLQGAQSNYQTVQPTSLLDSAIHDIGTHHLTSIDPIAQKEAPSNQEPKSSKAYIYPSSNQPNTPASNQSFGSTQSKIKQSITPPNPNLLSVNDLIVTMPADTVATKQQLSVSENLMRVATKTISQSADELMSKCYISPEMQCAVLSLVGRDWSIDKKSGIVPNIPTVQEILHQADSNLSDLENININTPALLKEQGYQNIANALKATIEAVNIAIFVDRVQAAYQDQDYLLYQKLDTDIYSQLTEYKKELIDKLADKRLQPTLISQLTSFGSWMLSFVWTPSKLKADNALEQMILDNNYKNIKSDSSGRKAANLLFKQCFIAQQLDKNIDLKISNLSDLLANIVDIDGFCKIAQTQGLKTNSIASIDDKSKHLIALHQSILNIRQAVQTALYIANKNSTFNLTYIPSPSSIPGTLGYIPQPSFLASYLDPIVGQLLEYDKKLARMSIDKNLGAHQNDITRDQLWTAISYLAAGVALGTAVYTDYQYGFGTSAKAIVNAPGNAINSVSNGYDAVYNYFNPAVRQPPVDQNTLLSVMNYKKPEENPYDKAIKIVPMPQNNSQAQNIFTQIKNAVTGQETKPTKSINSNVQPEQQAAKASSKPGKANSSPVNSQNNKMDKDVTTLIDKIEDVITSSTTPGELAAGVIGVGAVGAVGAAGLKLKSGMDDHFSKPTSPTVSSQPITPTTPAPANTSTSAQDIAKAKEIRIAGEKAVKTPTQGQRLIWTDAGLQTAESAAKTKTAGLGAARMLGAGAIGAAAVGALANTAKIGFTGKDLAGNILSESDIERMINSTDQATMDNYVDNGGQSQIKSYDFSNAALDYQNTLKYASKPGELATGIVGVGAAGAIGTAGLKLKSGIGAANSVGNIAASGAAQGISQLPQGVMSGGPTGFPVYEKSATPTAHTTNTKALTIYNPPAQINNKLNTAGMLGAGVIGAAAVGALANTAKIGFTGKNLAGNILSESDIERMINSTDQATMDNYVNNGGQSQMKSYDFSKAALDYQNTLKYASKNVATTLGIYQGPQQSTSTLPTADNQSILPATNNQSDVVKTTNLSPQKTDNTQDIITNSAVGHLLELELSEQLKRN